MSNFGRLETVYITCFNGTSGDNTEPSMSNKSWHPSRVHEILFPFWYFPNIGHIEVTDRWGKNVRPQASPCTTLLHQAPPLSRLHTLRIQGLWAEEDTVKLLLQRTPALKSFSWDRAIEDKFMCNLGKIKESLDGLRNTLVFLRFHASAVGDMAYVYQDTIHVVQQELGSFCSYTALTDMEISLATLVGERKAVTSLGGLLPPGLKRLVILDDFMSDSTAFHPTAIPDHADWYEEKYLAVIRSYIEEFKTATPHLKDLVMDMRSTGVYQGDPDVYQIDERGCSNLAFMVHDRLDQPCKDNGIRLTFKPGEQSDYYLDAAWDTVWDSTTN
ncbi:hypothetical protein BU24DRAFT_408881 [Aaosphaeria arxii CBS 175.79]|uniref:Uncharacterized protein n=1 Tax=Aaosphaeria arxii CBS 175.79 TaxID=1450172 RepID=A0A6A5XSK5_9PLEO|nr:uncharacterized protein BU24DRAFT_408881 [Aaosphaeria arxii CBS 175.79]KAF2015680.1 hypothetical protein BU24DRAFT_408881 [Aaosphaeria arxii CBS 175.79]